MRKCNANQLKYVQSMNTALMVICGLTTALSFVAGIIVLPLGLTNLLSGSDDVFFKWGFVGIGGACLLVGAISCCIWARLAKKYTFESH